MSDEIYDLYLLMLGLEEIEEFQRSFEHWPRRGLEFYWHKGYIIDYSRLLRFLDDIYDQRLYNNDE